MAVRRCKGCELSYPNDSEYHVCPVCQGKTQFDPLKSPGGDWEERLARVIDALDTDDSPTRKVILHRVAFLRDLGLPWDLATELGSRRRVDGSGYQVDPHDVQRLIQAGCSPITAARICN